MGHLLAVGELPAQLQTFLANPCVRKAGRRVDVDLRTLQTECHSRVPFVGGVELATLAKDNQVISNARLGLADLCAKVLHRRLDKDVPARLSTSWDHDVLDEAHVRYAALDAYASLQIHEALSALPSTLR